jgi:hypothetical protein
MRKVGIPSAWFEAFHTYGCKITEKDTIYYCDDIEVGRHETLPLSRQKPFFFLINLATVAVGPWICPGMMVWPTCTSIMCGFIVEPQPVRPVHNKFDDEACRSVGNNRSGSLCRN